MLSLRDEQEFLLNPWWRSKETTHPSSHSTTPIEGLVYILSFQQAIARWSAWRTTVVFDRNRQRNAAHLLVFVTEILGYTSGHFPEECSKFIGPKFDGDVVSRQLWSTISFSSVNGSQKKNWSILRWPDSFFTLKNPCVSIKRKANVEKIYDLRHIEVHICGQQQHKVKAAEFEGQ